MHLGAWSEVLLGIGEEVVRAGPDEVGTADFWIRDRELGVATLSTSPNELVSYETKTLLAWIAKVEGR
jgi:hypothetical protein